MRLLLPSDDTMPKAWLTWNSRIVEPEKGDSIPAKHAPGPCRIGNQKVRVPHRNGLVPVGWQSIQTCGHPEHTTTEMDTRSDVSWWASWGPRVCGNPVSEVHTHSDQHGAHYAKRGFGELSPLAAIVLGTNFMPSWDHLWRCAETLHELITHLHANTPEEYTPDSLANLPRKGAKLVREFGLYPPLSWTQAKTIRQMSPQLAYETQHINAIPGQFPLVGDISPIGFSTR